MKKVKINWRECTFEEAINHIARSGGRWPDHMGQVEYENTPPVDQHYIMRLWDESWVAVCVVEGDFGESETTPADPPELKCYIGTEE